MKGRQMIVHDPRLNNPFTTPPTLLKPPNAMQVWTVQTTEKADHIVGWAAEVAKGKSGNEKLDALHFMAHGYPGGIQIGADNISWHNIDLFKKLDGLVKGSIVFFSCQVGAEQAMHSLSYEMTIGNAVAAYAKCQVVACKVNQVYSFNLTTNVLDFGAFEGVVYVYPAGGGAARMVNYKPGGTVSPESILKV
jgi:hypothetical protein